jgi:hypothetical protein
MIVVWLQYHTAYVAVHGTGSTRYGPRTLPQYTAYLAVIKTVATNGGTYSLMGPADRRAGRSVSQDPRDIFQDERGGSEQRFLGESCQVWRQVDLRKCG